MRGLRLPGVVNPTDAAELVAVLIAGTWVPCDEKRRSQWSKRYGPASAS
jgi:hypothetical protein